jgi:hypothetical protein
MKITVRRAVEQDAIGMFKLCVEMHRTTLYSKYRFNPEKTVAQVLAWIASPAMVLIAVRTREDSTEEVVGFMVATRRRLWFSDDEVGGEDILFVRHDARGTRAALLLARAFREWGHAEPGLVDLRAGITTDQQGAGAERIYEHIGMKNVGANFVLDIERS